MEKLTKNTENGVELAETEKTEKQLTWERNHWKIADAIAKYVDQYASMPSKNYIAQSTGLSRETVYKHLKTYAENPGEQSTLDTFSVMTEHVIARVLKAAMQGDLNAARLFLDNMKGLNGPKQVNQQNNYVQINKTIINQQVIQQLKPEQLNRLEQFIAAELAENTVDNG